MSPRCGRCKRLNLRCEIPAFIPRRRHTDLLEQRALELELQLASLTARHDRQLVSQRLFEKIGTLEFKLSRPITTVAPFYPRRFLPPPAPSQATGKITLSNTEVGYLPVTEKLVVEGAFMDWDPTQQGVSTYISLFL